MHADVVKDIIVPEPYFTPGNGQYYGLGNNYHGYGYPVYNYPGQHHSPLMSAKLDVYTSKVCRKSS